MVDEPETQIAVPKWVRAPFLHFAVHQERLADFYHFSRSGFEMAIFSANRVKELKEELALATAACEEKDKELGIHTAYPRQEEDENDRVRQKRAEKAKHEVDAGFPILHEQQTVFLWSSLECLIEDFLTAWMENEPLAMQLDEVRKIKISISDYESLQGTEKYYYVVQELQHSVKSRFKRGAEQFESVLHIFGLSGEISDVIKRDLIEIESVRNVLLHRKGIVDGRFCRACPWLEIEIGTRVVVGEVEWSKYADAAFDYAKIVLERAKIQYLATAHPSEA